MDLKLVVLLLVCVHLVLSISWTPDEEDKKPPPKKSGCEPKVQQKVARRGYHNYRRYHNSRYRNSRYTNSRYRNLRYNRSRKSRIAATPTSEATCHNLVAFFDGTFHNTFKPTNDKKLRFEFRLSYDLKKKRYQGKMAHWDEKLAKSSDFLWCFGEVPKFNISKTGMSTGNYYSSNYVGTFVDGFNLFNFLDLRTSRTDGKFQLEKAVGHCTKISYTYKVDTTPDETRHNHCVCCGDTYNPDPSLNCPENPWAPKQKKPDC